jgi:hypothetical protein
VAKEHKINPVILPEGFPEFRRPRCLVNKEDWGSASLEELDQVGFDTRTVFYDVFVNASGDRLIAIGPPFLNLGAYFNDMRLSVNGQPIDYYISKLERGLVLIEANLQGMKCGAYDIVVSIEGCEWALKLDRSPAESPITLGLTTLQKDNELHWMLDWIEYYEKELGVEKVFLYDNNSAYQEKLLELLPDSVVVVPWNFPFGVTNNNRNKYLHAGQLNHCRLRFEQVNTFFNFDIDELLVIRNDKVRSWITTRPCVLFRSFTVPYFESGKSSYSFRDFKTRTTKVLHARKYSFSRKIVSNNGVHTPAFDHFSERYAPEVFTLEADVKDAYFLHYDGITTNWKKETSNTNRKSRLTPYSGTSPLVLDEPNFIWD